MGRIVAFWNLGRIVAFWNLGRIFARDELSLYERKKLATVIVGHFSLEKRRLKMHAEFRGIYTGSIVYSRPEDIEAETRSIR